MLLRNSFSGMPPSPTNNFLQFLTTFANLSMPGSTPLLRLLFTSIATTFTPVRDLKALCYGAINEMGANCGFY